MDNLANLWERFSLSDKEGQRISMLSSPAQSEGPIPNKAGIEFWIGGENFQTIVESDIGF